MNLIKHKSNLNRNIWSRIDALARHRVFSIILVGYLAFGGCWIFSLVRGIPILQVPGEFSFLLAADTFAHGRITNPTHPMWTHFETFQEIMKPSYMSKYPPGQGIFLALGKLVWGRAIYGVWLSAALMCAAICWMLYAWVAPRWALLGGIIVVMQFGVFTYWSQSYWGGAVAALAGALVFGALPRVFQYQRTRDALWLGLGIALMAVSLPAEAILLGALIAWLVLPWKSKREEIISSRFVQKIILPLGMVLFIVAAGTSAYNKKITGNFLTTPAQVYTQMYSSLPRFFWQDLRPSPQFNHKIMETFENNLQDLYYSKKKNLKDFLNNALEESNRVFLFFYGYPLGAIALAFSLMMLWKRPMILGRWIGAFVLVLVLIAIKCTSARAHDYAFLAGLVILSIVMGLRALSVLKKGNLHIGSRWIAALIIFQLGYTILKIPPARNRLSLARAIEAPQKGLPGLFTRRNLRNFILGQEGKHLVIVRYSPKFDGFKEWVFNEADIDQSRIVWARDMGKEHNAELLEYYKDRTIWIVELIWNRQINYDARE